jgi:hypothetical protein
MPVLVEQKMLSFITYFYIQASKEKKNVEVMNCKCENSKH